MNELTHQLALMTHPNPPLPLLPPSIIAAAADVVVHA